MAQIEAKTPMPGGEQLAGVAGLIPSAQAAERSPSGPAGARALAAKSAPEEEASYDPMTGMRISGPEPKPYDPTVKPGTIVEPNPIRDILQGTPRAESPQSALPPIAKPSARSAAAKTEDTTANKLNPKAEVQAAAAEEKAPMGPARPSFMDRVMGNLSPTELEKPAQKTIQSVNQEQKDADKLYGVDTAKMFDELRQDFRKSSGNLKDRSEKAAGMAFMMFGSGLMGAKKGRVGEALSRSGQQALTTYMGAMDKINDNEDKLTQRMQDLTMAENQFNRGRSDKALAEVQANKRDIQAIEAENNRLKNQAMIEGAKLTVDYFKNANPPAYQYLQRIVEAKRAEGITNYSITDALRDEKTGAARGEVTDKELQDAYEARRKEIMGTTKLKEFDRQYPTWREFAAKEGRSGSRSTSAPAQQFTEGQESKDANGKPIVFRSGQWVYK
jgi:hypothetical protein